MKRSTILIGIIMILALFLAACGGSAKKNSGGQTVYSPSWFQDTEDDLFVFANAQGMSRDERIAYDQANGIAMGRVAQEQSTYIRNRLEVHLRSAGYEHEEITQVTDNLTIALAAETIEGIKVINHETQFYKDENVYRCWIQVGIPKSGILRSTESRLQREEALLSGYNAAQARQLMEKELRELEEKERAGMIR